MFKEITTDQFDKQILNDPKPNVVEVYTENCPSCKVLNPIFEQTANSNKDSYHFYKLNAREHIEIAKRYKVLGVPTLLFFRHGKLVDKKTGVISQQKIEKRLKPLLDYSQEIAAKKEITGYFKLPWK